MREGGHDTSPLRLRRLPAEPLLRADRDHPDIADALDLVADAEGLVVGSPVYKASYAGLLKVFLDLLPMDALTGVPVLPILTGGSTAHVLALDYALKPLLTALGANTIETGRFIHSDDINPATHDASASITGTAKQTLTAVIDRFTTRICMVETARTSTAKADAAGSALVASSPSPSDRSL